MITRMHTNPYATLVKIRLRWGKTNRYQPIRFSSKSATDPYDTVVKRHTNSYDTEVRMCANGLQHFSPMRNLDAQCCRECWQMAHGQSNGLELARSEKMSRCRQFCVGEVKAVLRMDSRAPRYRLGERV